MSASFFVSSKLKNHCCWRFGFSFGVINHCCWGCSAVHDIIVVFIFGSVSENLDCLALSAVISSVVFDIAGGVVIFLFLVLVVGGGDGDVVVVHVVHVVRVVSVVSVVHVGYLAAAVISTILDLLAGVYVFVFVAVVVDLDCLLLLSFIAVSDFVGRSAVVHGTWRALDVAIDNSIGGVLVVTVAAAGVVVSFEFRAAALVIALSSVIAVAVCDFIGVGAVLN